MTYISSFQKDKTGHQEFMDCNPILARGATEICARFNLRMGGGTVADRERNPIIWFVTLDGLNAGYLRHTSSYKGPNKGNMSFFYTGPLVKKDRGTNASTRESSKITGIVSALSRNDEIPTTQAILSLENNALSYAFSVTNITREAHYGIEMTQRMQADLLKAFFENNYDSIVNDKEKYLKEYNKYIEAVKLIEHSKKAYTRFAAGSTAIGIFQDQLNGGAYYLVGDASQTLNKIAISGMTRYNSLSESPVAVDAAIIRTYMEGKTANSWHDNELKIKLDDKYYPDVDIATGYANATSGLWVLIPKNAE